MLTAEVQNLIMIGVVAIAALIIGVIIGNMAGRRGSKSSGNKKATAEIKKEGYAEIATLWYSSAAKHIVTQMNGDFFKEFSSLPVELQKKALRLSELFTDWVHAPPPVEEKPAEASVVEPAEPAETPEPAAQEPVNVFSDVEETQPQMSYERPGATKPLPFVENEPEHVEIPPVPPVVFTRLEPEVIEPVKPAQPIEPFNPLTPEEHISSAGLKSKTVAGQISDIIAEMIQDSPLRQKGVKLIERPDHGVDVWVGVEKFDGVGSIPYPEVKQLVREAATRWERENSEK